MYSPGWHLADIPVLDSQMLELQIFATTPTSRASVSAYVCILYECVEARGQPQMLFYNYCIYLFPLKKKTWYLTSLYLTK